MCIDRAYTYSIYCYTKTAPEIKRNQKYVKLIIFSICVVTLTLKNVLWILDKEKPFEKSPGIGGESRGMCKVPCIERSGK